MVDDVEDVPNEIFEAFEDMLRSSVQLLISVEPDAQRFIEMYTHFALADSFEFFEYMNIESMDEMRRVARMFAIQIWNGTPLPSNRYRPMPLATPGRNEACFCGSGLKYKQCCARLDAGGMPPIDPEAMTGCLLEEVSQRELKKVWRYLPHPLLGFIAGEWSKESEELAERGLLLLDPIFKQDEVKLDHRDELAFDVILDICTLLDKPRKKIALIKRMIEHPDKALQAAALHRQCCVLGDQGKDDEAWRCFQKAQRLDPDNPALSHLEILLLMQQGKFEQMQQRGSYWLKRLARMNRNGELDELIATVGQMISDTPEAMGKLLEHNVPGAVRFINWLKRAAKHPAKLMHKLKVCDDMSIIEPKNKAAAELLQQWNDMMWQCEDMWEAPDDWLSMLESHPELGGSITVIDDLIQAVRDLETPNPMLSFEPLLAMAMLQIKLLLPMHPKSEVKWAVMDNRPALRVLGFLASTMIEMGEHETAVEMMEWLLRLNPNDNQGFRSEVVNAYLRLNRNQDAVDLCEHYPEDFDVSICYGHALALFRRGERQQADARLKLAIKDCPKVARALVRNSMKQPKGLNPGMVTCGGDDEAWYYREDARDLWLGTPEAMAWLKQCIKAV